MDMIREKIESGEYKDPQLFYNDFELMFTNAKTYNLEGTLSHEAICVVEFSPFTLRVDRLR